MMTKRGYLGILVLVAACGFTACSSKNLFQKEQVPQLPIIEETIDDAEKNEYKGIGYSLKLDSDWNYSEKKWTELNFVYGRENGTEKNLPNIHTEVNFLIGYNGDLVTRYYTNRNEYMVQGYELQKAEMVLIDHCHGYRTEYTNAETGSALVQYFTIHDGTKYIFELETNAEEKGDYTNVLDRMIATVTWEEIQRAEVPDEGKKPAAVGEAEVQTWLSYKKDCYSLKCSNEWQSCLRDPFAETDIYELILFTAKKTMVMDGFDEQIEIRKIDARETGDYFELEECYKKDGAVDEFVEEGQFAVLESGRDITISGEPGYWVLSRMEDARVILYRLEYVMVMNGVKYVLRYEGDITDFEAIRPEVEAIVTTLEYVDG